MAAAMLILPLIDSGGKWLSTEEGVSPGQVAFFRFSMQFVVMAVVIVTLRGPGGLRPKRLFSNFFRGLLIGAASLFFFIAVKYMPLADAIAVFFVEPLILTLLSGIFLGEPIGWRRWAAVVSGFAGAIIVIQPSYELFGPVSLLPLATAVLFSIYMMLNRSLSTHDSPLVMQLLAGAGGMLISGLALLAGAMLSIRDLAPGIPLSPFPIILLIGVGAVAAGGHMMVTTASRHARASVLAPFQYLEIVSATAVGLIVFNDFPSALKWLGIAIIIGSGLIVLWRESRLAEKVPQMPEPAVRGAKGR